MGKRLEQTFLQKHTNGQEIHERMLNIIGHCVQIKATMRYHFPSTRMTIMKIIMIKK